jgi:uncharacterized protein (DUF1800 family)
MDPVVAVTALRRGRARTSCFVPERNERGFARGRAWRALDRGCNARELARGRKSLDFVRVHASGSFTRGCTSRSFVRGCESSLVVALALSCLAVASCGAGGSSVPDTPDTLGAPANAMEAARFLTQATFGPTPEEIDHVQAIGYSAWLGEQRNAPVSLERPELDAELHAGENVTQDQRLEAWWKDAIQGPDQLRLRMAWALSQILVISDVSSALADDPVGMAEYYDILARNALGNYRTLLDEVTLSPAMGVYLNVLKNQKADPAHNIHPDENYAREVMQLFTIGLFELAPDGTRRVDANGAFVPTYDQSVVEAYAADYTGWNYAGATSWEWPSPNALPMTNWLAYHDQNAKTILDGIVLPAGQSGEHDLASALDSLFQHPNVGPFLGRQLIERLVTSNPSPAYVERVAHAFADDGHGVRGDLYAVAKAILFDPEARHGHDDDPQHFGKLREPLLRFTALWRAFHATSPSGRFQFSNPEFWLGEGPLRSPSVFNFYSPDYQPPGPIADAGLYAPEFQITTDTFITLVTNELSERIFHGYKGYPAAQDDSILIDIDGLRPLAADENALVDRLNVLLMAGSMSSDMRSIVVSLVHDTPLGDGTQRVLEGIYIIASSPEGALQR